jgi:hypothetical protein
MSQFRSILRTTSSTYQQPVAEGWGWKIGNAQDCLYATEKDHKKILCLSLSSTRAHRKKVNALLTRVAPEMRETFQMAIEDVLDKSGCGA